MDEVVSKDGATFDRGKFEDDGDGGWINEQLYGVFTYRCKREFIEVSLYFGILI